MIFAIDIKARFFNFGLLLSHRAGLATVQHKFLQVDKKYQSSEIKVAILGTKYKRGQDLTQHGAF
jgi:hypothetical protein